MQLPIFIPEALTAVSSIALVLSLVGIAMATVALRRIGRVASHYEQLMTGVDGADVAAALESYVRRLAAAEQRLAQLEAKGAELDGRQRSAVQHVALLRYSAFPDSGGDQSFSLALLDDSDSGVVLSGLYGRAGMRMYAKPIAGGGSAYALTSEEERVLLDAGGSAPTD